ncbi:hypothetical protein [Pleionea sp. CnH1-48]|uniref:hypothetical protein n=1 Tax=Pleionea sp. CnH1-48 TaxID=2954494 RepID=UPI002097C5F1|nr:hypothetical protein [Pleionea sp. CnH1-48]MCO7225939.1 hypothetical protein [Pleionea sp. CnH1-48]
MKVRVLFFALVVNLAHGNELCTLVKGAKIFAQDSRQTYLGDISNGYQSKSIFNDFGTYGNEFSSESIWNEFSKFGNEFNPYSPFNEYLSAPPVIIKNGELLGFLSTNENMKGAVSPSVLKAYCEEKL